ncbi:MAG: amidohydrolase family protein [Candidatus Zixiibacteriota bacterium]|nr:MAG: amidohydrolase family protein [candidate division Zixibacteria bacterium]
MKRRDFIKAGSAAAAGVLLGCSVSNRFDLIIKNGTIIDGTGAIAFKTDLGITGDKITAIANLSNVAADRIIDAQGFVVSPGFIDIHTHTDYELLVNYKAESKLHQGVTTEISGNCGSSPFPLNDEDLKEISEDLLERYDLRVNWRTYDGFIKSLEKTGISVNYASLTGNGKLRSYVVGKNDVKATADQINQMKNKLSESMEMGSFGLSTGLEYAPSSYASTEELIELCGVVAKKGGIYATHTRNEEDTVEEAVDEALTICRESGASLQISHLKVCNKANWNKLDGIIEKIEKAFNSGMPVSADRYPYTAWGTGMSIFLPLWVRQGSTDEVLARLKDPGLAKKFRDDTIKEALNIGGWDRIMISNCVSDKNKIWEGKTIDECLAESDKGPFEFIRILLIEERLRVGIVGFAMNEDNLRKVLTSPLVMIGSDGSAVSPHGKLSEGKPHPRYYGTFPRVLGKYCREEKILDLPSAVKKMTSMPAEKVGLKGRGIIKKNNCADLVIFDPETVIDNATFTDPHKYPAGIEYVVVNGKITIESGQHTGTRSGHVLRHC